ncbi:DUF2971 domain-containing protein [Sphingomonas sp. G-3-2-10]|uniref:DUF2971 domain-containing protein n=1 Tax=Sphingomonas sp. G-3-2-10 TaxID=2728838 RepID=UPI00146A2E29|nr:DUF2971 domain-containing protein [Sphingomonas sp. G-3-2-10]NML04288.1 DUF2971 domain-containing protein [Sphingomonas sp. G-3-2-10]
MNVKENTPEEINKHLNEIAQPHVVRCAKSFDESGSRFVHYSTAQGALGIIENNCLWLRNVTVQNDLSEVLHGAQCLRRYWEDQKRRARFEEVLCSIDPEAANIVFKAMDGDLFELIHETYITCLSEHAGKGYENEDGYGRLSMWRAYNGGTTGVALVFDPSPFLSGSDAHPMIRFAPVHYADEAAFAALLDEVIEAIAANAPLIKEVEAERPDENIVADMMFNLLRIALVTTKHPGFHEEREWRIIYHPRSVPADAVNHITSQNVELGGVPQTIYKIPLLNYPDQGLTGATLPEAIHKVIIGPTSTPYVIWRRLWDALEAAGVNLDNGKLWRSEIPLRV